LRGRRLEGVASGYWTPSAKRSSGFNQPLRFDSVALCCHSTISNVLDIASPGVILEVFRGRRSS
jgi:hypothetical protein